VARVVASAAHLVQVVAHSHRERRTFATSRSSLSTREIARSGEPVRQFCVEAARPGVTIAVVVERGDNDTPFAHVPEPGAGPIPAQEGPFTWDKVAASAGSGGYGAHRMSGGTLAFLLLLGVGFLALVVLTISGALT
jgi:hypothetical protein